MTEPTMHDKFNALKLIMPNIEELNYYLSSKSVVIGQPLDGWINCDCEEEVVSWLMALNHIGFNVYREIYKSFKPANDVAFFRENHEPLWGPQHWWKPFTYPNEPIYMER